MAAQRLFGEDEVAVDRHLKQAPLGRDQAPGADVHLDVSLLQNLSRQTDGALRVVSNRAVFERNVQQRKLHGRLSSEYR